LIGYQHQGSTSIERAMKYLKNYRWNSFLDYIGKQNFPSVTSRSFLLEFFGGESEYEKATLKWLEERERNAKIIEDVKLD